jgi:hypothetical protein
MKPSKAQIAALKEYKAIYPSPHRARDPRTDAALLRMGMIEKTQGRIAGFSITATGRAVLKS